MRHPHHVAVIASLLLFAVAAPAVAGKGARPKAPKSQKVKKTGVTAGRAWDAALELAPKDTDLLLGVDVARLQRSSLYTYLQAAVGNDAKQLRDAAKSECKLDPDQAVDSLALTTDKAGRTLLFIKWRGHGQPEVDACGALMAQKMFPGAKLTVTRTGDLVEYALDQPAMTMYAAWPSADVLVLAPDGGKAEIEQLLARKSAGLRGRAEAKAALGAIDTGAALWGVYLRGEDLGSGMKFEWIAGQLDVRDGALRLELIAAMTDESAARAAAAQLVAGRDQLAAQYPSPAKDLLTALVIEARGPQLRVALAMDEAAFLAAMKKMIGI